MSTTNGQAHIELTMCRFAEYEERFGAYYDNLEHVG